MSDETTMQEGDDPADFSATTVLEYLDTASGTERTRVYDAERNGKQRVTILNALSALTAPEDGALAPQGMGDTSVEGYTLVQVDADGNSTGQVLEVDENGNVIVNRDDQGA